MFKKRILYSDIPRPYDQDAVRLVKAIGIIILLCILVTACLLVFGIH